MNESFDEEILLSKKENELMREIRRSIIKSGVCDFFYEIYTREHDESFIKKQINSIKSSGIDGRGEYFNQGILIVFQYLLRNGKIKAEINIKTDDKKDGIYVPKFNKVNKSRIKNHLVDYEYLRIPIDAGIVDSIDFHI